MKQTLFLIFILTVIFHTNAQTDMWTDYLNVRKQFHEGMHPCEMLEKYSQIDSIFHGYIPLRRAEMNYMEAALQCGDTATFKRIAYRVVRWKGWNPMVFEYREQYAFLKGCDYWPELDSIQQSIHSKKNYVYAETLRRMQESDQEARRAFYDPDHTHTQEIEDSLSRRMHEVDSVNLARLVWLMDTFGFPTWERVCSYGAAAAWIVAQHGHPWFQYDYVKQLRQAVADTNADPSHLAYLEDRLRTGRGLPQLYGTQFSSTAANTKQTWLLPVTDIKNVNHRRAEMQMLPLETYIDAYAASYSEQGMLDSDAPVIDIGDDYVRFYYLGDQFSLLPTEMQQGVTDAVEYMQQGDYCAAIPLFCYRLQGHYPFVRDLQCYLECLLRSDCTGDQYCYISHYEVLERMVLCGYQPDEWLSTLPDSLTVPLMADYAKLREEYERYLNHEDDDILREALGSREAFETLLRSGKNYHRYELDAWNHAYPALLKMTESLTRHDYKDFFALLWREVERGNIHAEDYASLYDRTQYRLHGKDWYGTLADRNKHITTFKPSKLLERRHASCLPPIESHNR